MRFKEFFNKIISEAPMPSMGGLGLSGGLGSPSGLPLGGPGIGGPGLPPPPTGNPLSALGAPSPSLGGLGQPNTGKKSSILKIDSPDIWNLLEKILEAK